MYYYVYDEFVQDPKFERELSLIETRLTDLGIAGKIARLALFRDPKELIKDEIKKGAKTIIAVGNDSTLRKIIDAATGSNVVIGIVPLGRDMNLMSEMLGMPNGVEACDVLSARIVEELDLGSVNGNRFLNSAVIHNSGSVVINCDNSFKMTPTRRCSIEIRNLAPATEDVSPADPTDGKLELIIRTPEKKLFGKKKITTSVVPISEATIISDSLMRVLADGDLFEGSEFKFRVLPKQLRVITGKGRQF
ncbi:hypothetical protein CO057_01135 [Candidatus Uhrbacteria bacterium CG_4_9_14_0_2_um_filter_41_50]|uniref:DAGKc domain-containing protein n=1 Tax=Candidatus Uhrbacteria bacterium CG_4_9_14_0_2_um_filter_41_50 TaxID=1975031 RepID=A0A2M8EPT7_9BACT|nr:MAG: hypothetical protein COZ45_02900 [Candidatus Uhrbacteria bacterium CG_4_10_14_3_um_filter_41_21]PIZ54300.1 MAG: hypothetical protein COY24_04240 [Candidatus Uhrbacteria bacterium CG_4_10_14_0_2_um_filter_41_21]PJB85055.1 MAG: hypothetical protein CO086_00300 [Candidatus Uhrbacteria bacterium CG_4_9_14_0_8_um_filter_41_16]PJC24759.1 MAG: hypothetical protein CO057_01135 [Candidatus Uhrbacteria bacterium CG_4_9_14_0_2_um_filter_41_50]PJE75360.1 MAG: hypothetical protein COV03_00555 [Candi